MNKFTRVICGILFSFLASAQVMADDEEFKEGEYYTVVQGNELSKVQEITEFMSFYCGHCFMFRSTFNQLKGTFPEVTFSVIPVAFLGGPMGQMSQKAYATAKIMGIEEQYSNELFNQIHQMHKTDYNPEALADIAAYVGADKQKFLEIFDSFVVVSQIAAYNAEQDRAGIKGVPSLMVNHKYVIIKAEKDQVASLIRYLLNKDGIKPAAAAPAQEDAGAAAAPTEAPAN